MTMMTKLAEATAPAERYFQTGLTSSMRQIGPPMNIEPSDLTKAGASPPRAGSKTSKAPGFCWEPTIPPAARLS